MIFKHLAGVVKRPNTPGCEPGIRQFESDHSPQTIKIEPNFGSFFILYSYFIEFKINKKLFIKMLDTIIPRDMMYTVRRGMKWMRN